MLAGLIQCGPNQGPEVTPSPFMLNPTLPVERTPTPPQQLLIVGDSLSSNTLFSHTLIDEFSEFAKHCPGVTTEYKKISSFALPSSSPRHMIADSGSHRDWLCQQKRIYRNNTAPDISGEQFCRSIGQRSAFEKLVDEDNPTDVIIALGTNSLAFSGDFIVARVNDMLSQLPEKARCFWVGPTYVSAKYQNKLKKVEAAIIEALDSSPIACQYIATYEAMKNQTQCSRFYVNDGIHHTRCGSELWAEDVFSKVCSVY